MRYDGSMEVLYVVNDFYLQRQRIANLANWNERVNIHKESPSYGTDRVRFGASTLLPVEIAELGSVSGKSLLHLQCHFGLDSLSLARAGARVTGVDFSDEAIRLAKQLNQELGLDVSFVCSDVYRVREVVNHEYDVVFTSYGVLCWLPDLMEWAKVIYDCLRPGGMFYIVEGHPVGSLFEPGKDGQLERRYPYFTEGTPILCESETSYTGDAQTLKNTTTFQWDHAMSEIVGALLEAGLHLEHLHEFPYSAYCNYPGLMVQRNDGYWELKEPPNLPLLFSLKAIKPVRF